MKDGLPVAVQGCGGAKAFLFMMFVRQETAVKRLPLRLGCRIASAIFTLREFRWIV